MVDRFQSLGGTFMASTPARQIIADGGKVSGVYAEGPDGVIQVNAKAVILATGGYANSTDILTQCGCNPDKVAVFGMPGHDGDGMPMGLAAGAKSWLSNSSLMEYPMNPALDKDSSTISNNDWPVLSLMSYQGGAFLAGWPKTQAWETKKCHGR